MVHPWYYVYPTQPSTEISPLWRSRTRHLSWALVVISPSRSFPWLWMAFVRENPNLTWMMTGGTPMTMETPVENKFAKSFRSLCRMINPESCDHLRLKGWPQFSNTWITPCFWIDCWRPSYIPSYLTISPDIPIKSVMEIPPCRKKITRIFWVVAV